jgi:alpha-amylase/alpha-mannosidase (GH57 family)
MTLPQKRFTWAEDIPRHLQKSWDLYRDRFGCDPRGLWPSEQSVSPAIVDDIVKQGFKWICTDEAILGNSLQHFFHRDGAGNVLDPELLYRPYNIPTDHGDLSVVFRDHRLSDLIGFSYSGMTPHQGATDLIGHLEAISRSLINKQTSGTTSLDKPWLVTIALDGENCWEHYYLDGKPFLETLYETLSRDPHFKLVTVNEFIEEFPVTATLPPAKLHSGSWVDGSFTTWIGDPAKNRAWDLLTEARQVLANHPEATPENNPDAWEALYAAEGSDWFWWFGEGHSSNQDAMFDQLFREHLIALYEALSEPVPQELYNFVESHQSRGPHRPEGYIHPIIDGNGDEQDWDLAGRIEIGGARGTMHQSSTIQRIFYGVDHLNFYLRLDFEQGTEVGVDLLPELNLLWYFDNQIMHNSPIPLVELPDQEPLNYRYHHRLQVNLFTKSVWFQEAGDYDRWESRMTRTQVGYNKCLEIAVPWADLHTQPNQNLKLLLVFSDHGRYRQFLPEDSLISIVVP